MRKRKIPTKLLAMATPDKNTQQTKKQTLTEKKKEGSTAADPLNPFHLIKVMIGQSIGKIPAGLVFILAVAVVLSVATGLAMQMRKAERSKAPETRLLLSDTQIDPAVVSGIWMSKKDNYVMSLGLMSDHHFEWTIQDKRSPKVRHFIRGDWSVNSDILILSRRKDLGYPFDAENPSIRYMPLPLENIETRISLDGKRMLWSVPQSEYPQIKGFMVKLFDRAEKTDIAWNKN